MTEVAKLPLSCERLEVLDESTIAACGQQVVYFRPLPGSAQAAASASSVEVSLTESVHCCAPWHPPGAALQQCGVFYAEAGHVHFCRSGGSGGQPAQESRKVLQPPPPASDGIAEMRVFFGTTLVVRTADAIACYALDPALGAEVTQAPLLGRVVLQHPAPAGDATEVVLMDGSPAGEVDHSIAVVMYCNTTRRLSALLLAVGPACVTVLGQTRDGGLAMPLDVNAPLSSWSFDWARREVLFVFAATATGPATLLTRTLSLATMEWAASSTDLTPLPFVPADVAHTHTGDTWALKNSGEGAVKLFKLSPGCVTREVALQHSTGRGTVVLTTLGSRLYVLLGASLLELREEDGNNGTTPTATLCDWLVQQIAREPHDGMRGQTSGREGAGNSVRNEMDVVLDFVNDPASSLPAMIVRDCRYVSCAPDAAEEYRHAILDALQAASGQRGSNSALLRYITVAQSLHPSTILRVLSVPDPSVRLSLAVLLATKPPLMAGGVRLLEWGSPVRVFCQSVGPTQAKLFTAALCESALTALAAGALGAVELLCAVADFVMVATLGSDRRAAVSREEAAAEVSIAEAVGVLSSYAQWALAAAPALGTITAHVGPVRNGTKEAAVRDRVAHGIVLSRSVQIEPMSLLRRQQAS
ncbi:uncharacterized protein Tco025E_04473 [Trypanosoma conorhini]|uniref:Uncharacterized protein n=1 Tax=Trypanosoma conorhini TaxID=83891 RepID=A0A3R7LPR1_9TRYP|nr:uncharacterized protein Tco025E_04473 [Trypanosoma conorhini]RNF18453.1 hypothetical protein Tco025E_04473 [Trypanosoma conorhini]